MPIEVVRSRLRGPQLGRADCSAAWTPEGDPTWPSELDGVALDVQPAREDGWAWRLKVQRRAAETRPNQVMLGALASWLLVALIDALKRPVLNRPGMRSAEPMR